MKEKIKEIIILAVIIILIGGSIAGFFIWNHQKTIERKYQACLEKCEASVPRGLSKYFDSSGYMVCVAECKEKYAK